MQNKKWTLIIAAEFNKQFSVGLASGKQLLFSKTINKPFKHSEFLLKTIIELLRAAEVRLDALNQIIIADGPGDFSALRTGIATANTLAYALDIPIGGAHITKSFENEKEKLQWLLSNANINKKQFGMKNLVMPKYDKEPNIRTGASN
ncbi:MAG: hypothetical protein V1902_03520 [Candidatus Falkowbacteria bacterium]